MLDLDIVTWVGGGTSHELFEIGTDWREQIYVGKIIQR